MTEEPQAGEAGVVGTRWPEVIVAAFLVLLGVMVVTDSIRVGTGWGDDGPRSGYFPFYIGSLLILSSGWVLVTTLLKWNQADPAFAERSQLRSVMAVLVPMTLYVGAIALVGIYLASIALIGYFMRRHGKFGWPLTAAVAVGVPMLFFLVFEKWFLVPLPKGPIEQMLGF
ncbi:MAG: tricarboxylate transporter [Methylibium sp. NZG]|nr:MAG: tricarboxylate transporter [Methylibium sp. NZG]